MKIESDDIDAAALELWTEVFKAQCSLPLTGDSTKDHVVVACMVADYAEVRYRARIAKVPT